MNLKDFKAQLAPFLDAENLKRHFGEAAAPDVLRAPFNNFFGDDLLTLLSRSTDILPKQLALLKTHLEVVSNKKLPRHRRAEAALAVGRHVRKRGTPPRDQFDTDAAPGHWFALAASLNSVLGALELANEYLTADNLRVRFEYPTQLLPEIVSGTESGEPAQSGPSSDAAQAWLEGARLCLRHVQGNFKYWDVETFGAAFACIVNWLVLLPGRKLSGGSLAQRTAVEERMEAMKWIRPLWKRLVKAASPIDYHTEFRRMYLLEQAQAVGLFLAEAKEGGSANPFEPARAAQHSASPATVAGESVVVIRGIIAPGSDKSETTYLAAYEALRKPIALTPMPDAARLSAIRLALEAEFPWASEPIRVVLSGLVARERHGVTRLGMQPVLLAGKPGSGKTRFAQRLSELLGAPNTVIAMAGMSDTKLLKGVTRGWSSNRPSRLIEFILQTKVANPLFILDEIEKARGHEYSNGGSPMDALLDLLEIGNARRYSDIFLLTECDLSHCLYIATSNSLAALPEPVLSRLQPVFFPTPGPEHAEVILKGLTKDIEREWNLPPGALTVSPRDIALLRGLAPREMRRALLDLLGDDARSGFYTVH